ncbi:Transcriptional regulator, AraC family [Planctomycetales bacterium 10988]|nr:Transcriptional regulator, AraC family [Planctomycetales bacterium 10988]
MQIHLFDTRMLTPLVRFLEHTGTGCEQFLHRAQIPGELLEKGGWIGKKQAYDFTFDIVQRLGSPDVIFTAYLNFQMEHLGPIAQAMRACKTVKESLELGARLGSIAYEGNQYFLEIDGDTTWFSYREPKVISLGQTFIHDMTLAVYYHLINACVEEEWRPERIRTRGMQIDRHQGLEIFEDCRAIAHPHSTGLAFPTEFLSRRLCSQPSLNSEDLAEWQFGPQGSEPIVEKLYRLISSCCPYRKPPTLKQVGSMLDVSPRTIKRELKSAGTSYRGLLDRFRFDVAVEMLSTSRLTIREIASELGYSGTNNFVRSFRRMTGTTPGQYREQHFEIDGNR